MRRQGEERKSRLRSAQKKEVPKKAPVVVKPAPSSRTTPAKSMTPVVAASEVDDADADDWEVTGSDNDDSDSESDSEIGSDLEDQDPRKAFLTQGLYVGDDDDEDDGGLSTMANGTAKKRGRRSRSRKSIKPLTWFKLPIKEGKAKMEEKKDFVLPFNVYCPLVDTKVKPPKNWKPTNRSKASFLDMVAEMEG